MTIIIILSTTAITYTQVWIISKLFLGQKMGRSKKKQPDDWTNHPMPGLAFRSWILYHFDWFGLGCDWWPDGQNFNYIQCWCDLRHGLKFGWPWETEGEASKAWSGNVVEKSLVVKKEWSGQSGDLSTHWWQLIIKERREDQILQQFPSIILLHLSIWTSSISLINQSVSSLNK